MLSEQVAVVAERCVACGLCERLAPDLFAVVGHRVAVPLVRQVSGCAAEVARDVADACPTVAIELRPVPVIQFAQDGGRSL